MFACRFLLLISLLAPLACGAMIPGAFMDEYGADRHDAETKKGGLDLTTLSWDLEAADLAFDDAVQFGPEPARLSQRILLNDEKGVRDMLDKNDPNSKHRHVWLERPDASVYFDKGYPAAEIKQTPSHPGRDAKGQSVYNVGAKEFTGPRLALLWLEIEGPLLQEWPPASMKNLSGETPLAYDLAPEDARVSAEQAMQSIQP